MYRAKNNFAIEIVRAVKFCNENKTVEAGSLTSYNQTIESETGSKLTTESTVSFDWTFERLPMQAL